MRATFSAREKGFSLLEVVFAVSILAFGMMGYMALKVSSQYSWVFAKNLSQAVQLTGSNLEGLKMAGYNNEGWMSPGDHTQADSTGFDADGDGEGDKPAVTSGDFAASSLGWTVKDHCPSQLSKLVIYKTSWAGGHKSLTIPQVQVRP